ncbi:MAG: hypothetical protein RR313_00050 [Anaerovoracaceae bacterium]
MQVYKSKYSIEVNTPYKRFKSRGLNIKCLPEVEFFLPISNAKGKKICETICNALIKGLQPEDGEMVNGLFPYPVFFFKVVSAKSKRNVLRVVFPDDTGLFPWENSVLKKQIKFNTDKVFMFRTNDTKAVEQCSTKKGSPYYTFTKKHDVYLCPVQYFIPDENKSVRVSPYNDMNVDDYMKTLKVQYGICDIKLVCKDVDYSDPINASFYECRQTNCVSDGDYASMGHRDWPTEIKNIVEKAYMCMAGYVWQHYEENGEWFIKVVNINHLDKWLWLKVRKPSDEKAKPKNMYLDFFSGNVSEIEKYKMLYYTERNRTLLCKVFIEEKDKDWVIR